MMHDVEAEATSVAQSLDSSAPSGHTPGPWRADLHHTAESAGRTYAWVRGGNQFVPLAGVTLGVEGMPQDEGRANAVLLAAAPDLLDALRVMLRATDFDDDAPWVVQAHAAIAKATRGDGDAKQSSSADLDEQRP